MIKNIILKKNLWIIFFIYSYFILNSTYFSLNFLIISIGIFLLNVLPLFNFYINYKKINYIPLYYFTHIFFFACYTLGLFFTEYLTDIYVKGILRYLFEEPNLQNLVEKSMAVYLVALFFFNLGNFVIIYFTNTNLKSNNFFEFKENENEILLLGLTSYFLSLIFIFVTDLTILQKLYQTKYPLTYLSLISIQLYIIFKKDLKFIYKMILYLLVYFIVFIELLDGSIAKSFLYLIAIYLLNFIVTKKINFKFLTIIILMCVSLHTFKYEYRNLVWAKSGINDTLVNYNEAKKENKKELSKIDETKLFINSYKHSFLNYDKYLEKKNVENSVKFLTYRNYDRLTHSFQSLIIVISSSPKPVPYWEGYSYKIFATKFIPRIFWKNKPSDTLGNEFGKRYGVLGANDQTTSWNMPVLNEFFVNFGLIGIVVGMFILGLIFSSASILLNYKYNNYLFIISFITLYPLFYLESHFSLTFGAVVQTFIFLLIYSFLFKIFLLIMKKFF